MERVYSPVYSPCGLKSDTHMQRVYTLPCKLAGVHGSSRMWQFPWRQQVKNNGRDGFSMPFAGSAITECYDALGGRNTHTLWRSVGWWTQDGPVRVFLNPACLWKRLNTFSDLALWRNTQHVHSTQTDSENCQKQMSTAWSLFSFKRENKDFEFVALVHAC